MSGCKWTFNKVVLTGIEKEDPKQEISEKDRNIGFKLEFTSDEQCDDGPFVYTMDVMCETEATKTGNFK